MLGFELTQKEFNRKVKSSMMQHIPVNDQHLGMTEMCEKYPDKISRIKGSLFISCLSLYNLIFTCF